MRILQIITRMDSIGGAQRHVVELSRAAVERGHTLHLAYGGDMALSADEVEGLELHPVPELVRPIAPWKDLKALFVIRKLIKTIQPDLVATHSTKAGVIGRYAAWMTATPDVHTVHGWSLCFSGNRMKRMLYTMIEGKTHRLADGLICVSQFDLGHAKELGLKASRLKLIYNGRPDAPAIDDQTPEDTNHVRIISVGRLAWPKLPRQLIHFLTKAPTVHLDLVGDGPDEEKTREYAEDIEVADRVIFHGHVANIYPLMARAEIFALVSDWEGFPMSTLEAMSMGLPTVVSGVGGAGEAINDGDSGYIIPRGDEQALHEKLLSLVDKPENRKTMGHNARQLFDEKFRLDTMVDKTLSYYEEVLER